MLLLLVSLIVLHPTLIACLSSWIGLGLLSAQETVSYRDFGAVGDGKTDDFAALIKAHEHANAKGLAVRAEDDATYYIGAADRTIPVETSTDFGKAKFIIDDTRVENHRAQVFEVRSQLKKINLQGVEKLKRGQDRMEAKLPGSCLILVRDDSVKRFIRRGGNQNKGSSQTDVFLVDAHGRVDPKTPIIWDFEQISKIEALPVDQESLIIKGGHFTTIAHSTKSTDYHARGIGIRRSNVLVEGLEHHITAEGEDGPPYRGFLAVSNAANVVIRDCVLTGHKTYYKIGSAGRRVPMGSYDISINSSVNVALVRVTQTNDIMERKYWGIIGTNFCKNLVYDGCKLSRFDAHQGVTNATIRNSTLGHMGVKLTGFGEFLIENSTVQDNEFITLRPDYGSTWNGKIVIRDCRFITNARTPAIIAGSNDGRHDFGYTCHLPTQVLIDGLRIEDGKNSKGPVIFGNFNPGYKEGAKLPHPQVVTRQVAYRRVTTTSGKELLLSENKALFEGLKIHAPEDK